MHMPKVTDLRHQLRNLRRQQTPRNQRKNSRLAARLFIRHWTLLKHRRIALYIAADSEIDPAPLLDRLQKLNKRLFLPVLRRGLHRALWFSEYRSNDILQINRYGIPEPNPRYRKPVKAWSLGLVIMPLVGFSNDGTRLGMGGGYYDRTFYYQKHRQFWKRPLLIGYAYESQRVNKLPQREWDIPMHGVVTEQKFEWFKPRH